MYNYSRTLRYILVTLFSLVFLSACQKSTQPASDIPAVPGIMISIVDDVCPSVEISISDQVTWVNEDDEEHPIRVESSGEQDFRTLVTADLGPGDTTSLTFPEAGSYTYSCSINQESIGKITVKP